MVQVTLTHTVSEFCLTAGVTEDDLTEIVGLGVIEPRYTETAQWVFIDQDIMVVLRAARLRRELALDWPGIAVVMTLLDENSRIRHENHQLNLRLSRFLGH